MKTIFSKKSGSEHGDHGCKFGFVLPEIRNRPMLLVFFCLCSGVSFTQSPVLAVLAALTCVALAHGWTARIACLVLFGTGFFLAPRVHSAPLLASKPYSGTVRVLAAPQSTKSGTSCLVRSGEHRYVMVETSGSEVGIGDLLSVKGELRPLPEGVGNFRASQGYLMARHVEIVHRGPAVWRSGDAVRKSFEEAMGRSLSPESSSFVRAVCFNDTSGLDRDDWTNYRRAGVTHIVSASGFHVIVAAALLAWLVSLVPISRPLQIALIGVALFVFALAAGFRPPIVRAVLMACTGLAAYFWRREADGLSSLAFAGALNVLWDPYAVQDLGFHLSLAAVAGLVMYAPDPNVKRNWSQSMLALFGANAAAIAATLPLVLYVFGRISLWSLLGNLVIVPLVALTVWLSMAGWLVGLAVPPLGAVMVSGVLEPLVRLTNSAVGAAAQLPGSDVGVPWFPIGFVWAAYAAMLLFWRPTKREA